MSGKGLFSPGSFQSPKEIAFYSNVTAKELGCLIQSPDKNPEKSTINMTCMGMVRKPGAKYVIYISDCFSC